MSERRNSSRGRAPTKHSKRYYKKKRRQRAIAGRLIALTGVLLVAAVTLMILAPRRNRLAAPTRSGGSGSTVPLQLADDVGRQVDILAPAAPSDGGDPEEIPSATEAPAEDASALKTSRRTQTPSDAAVQAQNTRYLPVYRSADTAARRIAITVDDCYQVNNLQEIVKVAYKNGAKLTLFPVGENLSKAGMAETLKTCAFKLGYEIENHTWSHARIFRLPESEMAAEIWKQSQALNAALGVNYEQHFFRLMGGDGTSDLRTHNYLSQLGYRGIASWSVSGSDSTMEMIEDQLRPGAIYLFHTTDGDTEKLRQFIPYAISQGYELVTMNELLGFKDNAVSAYQAQEMPAPRAFAEDYRTHRQGDYAWNIVKMQDALRSLGFLEIEGASTGYYGAQTAQAVRDYQVSVGLPATGEADIETQKRLLAQA